MTGSEVIADNSNTRGWLFHKNNRRTLDVFYTDYDTKLFVEDGTLIEEKIKRSRTDDSSHEKIKRSRTDDSSHEKTMKRFVEDETLIEEKTMRSRTDDLSDEMSARLSEYYVSTSPPESPGPTPEEAKDHSQTIRSAKLALAYYNNKHRTDYELVDPVVSNGALWRGGIWIHANFTASESSKKSDCSAKLFFAELTVAGRESGVAKYSVTDCRPLNGAKSTTTCEMCECDGDIAHPTSPSRAS